MHRQLVSTDNPLWIRLNADNPGYKSEELFKAPSSGHKFTADQECELMGLVDFPEFNGTAVTITAIREDGPKGKAYYIKGPIDKFVNWVYEYRLNPPAKTEGLK